MVCERVSAEEDVGEDRRAQNAHAPGKLSAAPEQHGERRTVASGKSQTSNGCCTKDCIQNFGICHSAESWPGLRVTPKLAIPLEESPAHGHGGTS